MPQSQQKPFGIGIFRPLSKFKSCIHGPSFEIKAGRVCDSQSPEQEWSLLDTGSGTFAANCLIRKQLA